MNYIEIKTKECFESKTNPRGSSESFKKDSTFKDLVSSIKEKGIQMLVEEDTKVELATDEEHNATATMFGFSATQKDDGESVLVLAPLNPVDTY
jgi:hypothetical protein